MPEHGVESCHKPGALKQAGKARESAGSSGLRALHLSSRTGMIWPHINHPRAQGSRQRAMTRPEAAEAAGAVAARTVHLGRSAGSAPPRRGAPLSMPPEISRESTAPPSQTPSFETCCPFGNVMVTMGIDGIVWAVDIMASPRPLETRLRT